MFAFVYCGDLYVFVFNFVFFVLVDVVYMHLDTLVNSIARCSFTWFFITIIGVVCLIDLYLVFLCGTLFVGF